MRTFRIALHRDYLVEIDAKNREDARRLTEFFLSTPKDASSEKERHEHSFRIGEIEMVNNDAMEAEDIEA